MNGAAEAPDGSFLIACGHVNQRRTILKINPSDGSILNQFQYNDLSMSAFEFCFFDNNVLYLSGLASTQEGGAWNFKSSGNVDGGRGLWQSVISPYKNFCKPLKILRNLD